MLPGLPLLELPLLELPLLSTFAALLRQTMQT